MLWNTYYRIKNLTAGNNSTEQYNTTLSMEGCFTGGITVTRTQNKIAHVRTVQDRTV